MEPVRASLFVLLALTLIPLGRSARAQEEAQAVSESVQVQVTGSAVAEVEPGSTYTASFRISNRGSDSLRIEPAVHLPDRWASTFATVAHALQPGRSVTTFVVVRVPDDMAPGDYAVRLRVSVSSEDPVEAAHSVRVRRKCSFSIQTRSTDRFVEAGGTLLAAGQIHNSGNVDVTVLLRARSGREFRPFVDSTAIDVPAGGSATFDAGVRTPRNVRRRELRALIVTATAPACPGMSDDDAVLFDVIPRAGQETANRGLPVAVTLNTTAAGADFAAQVGVAAGGFVNEAETRRVDVELQLPDQRRSSRFGQRGIMRAMFESPSLTVTAGDTRFGYSTLTRFPGLGRGLSLEARRGPLTAGAFMERSRYGFPLRSRHGVLLGFRTTEWSFLGATYLRRAGADHGETVTVYATASPGDLANLSLEIGDAVAGARRTGAVALELKGRYNQLIQYASRAVHAGPDFPGQYADFDLLQASITLRPAAGMSVFSSVRAETQSFESSLGSSRWRRDERNVRAGVGWRTGDSRDFSLKLDVGRRDRSTASNIYLGQSELDLRLTTGSTVGPAFASAYVTTGRFSDGGMAPEYVYRQFGLSAETSVGVHSVAMSVDHYRGARIERPSGGRSTAIRLGAASRINDRTRIEVDGFLSRDDYWGGLYELIHARLLRRVGRAEVTARFQYTSLGTAWDQSATDIGITVRVPLSVPNPFRVRGQRVRGRVFDAVTGHAVLDVLVHLADSHSLTDDAGRFDLRYPGDGDYLLNIDSSTLDVGVVPMLNMPTAVRLDDGASDIDIPLAQAAAFGGRFLVVEQRGTLSDGPRRAVRPVPLAVVEIDDGIGTYRTVTNAAGRFLFPKIRPGIYRVAVVQAELPRLYQLERDEYSFSVEPGGDTTLEILALRNDRRIRIISGGELGIREKPSRKEPVQTGRPDAEVSCSTSYPRAADGIHRMAAGESLSLLARTYYGDALLWPVIWTRNRDRIIDPDLVPVELAVWIPARTFEVQRLPVRRQVVTVERGSSLESLAEAYLGLRELWPLLATDGGYDVAAAASRAGRIVLPSLTVTEVGSACPVE